MKPSGEHRRSGVPVSVTGAGGFIGSHLVEALVECGAQARSLVRYTSRGDVGATCRLADTMSTTFRPAASQLEPACSDGSFEVSGRVAGQTRPGS